MWTKKINVLLNQVKILYARKIFVLLFVFVINTVVGIKPAGCCWFYLNFVSNEEAQFLIQSETFLQQEAYVKYTSDPGRGGTAIFGLYGYVPLDRVWFFGLAVLNRVWYYEPRDLNPDYEQALSFLRLRPQAGLCDKLKELAIGEQTSDTSLFLICIISTE